MAILDGAMGLVPMYTPRESQIAYFEVLTANTVYPGQPLTAAGGKVLAETAGAAATTYGVCLDYGEAGDKVAVCIDPDMLYRVKGDASFSLSHIGLCATLASNGGDSDTRKATGVLDVSTATGTPTLSVKYQIVGEYNVVTPETDPQWFIVKIIRDGCQFGINVAT